jgi:hypothetical protein
VTRSEKILKIVHEEIERHRRELDADESIHTVSLVITLSSKGGRPVRVLYRTEAQRDLTMFSS